MVLGKKILIGTGVGVLAFALFPGVAQSGGCTPEITQPKEGAIGVSLTPTIKHDMNNQNCKLEHIKVEVWTAEGAEDSIAKRVFLAEHSSEGWAHPYRNKVPRGKLEPNSRYKVVVEQLEKTTKEPAIAPEFDKGAGIPEKDSHYFYTKGGKKRALVIDSTKTPGRTAYTVKASEGVHHYEGKFLRYRGSWKKVDRQDNDKVSGKTAMGYVNQGRDGLLIRGDIEKLNLAEPSKAELFMGRPKGPNGGPASIFVLKGKSSEGTDYHLHTGRGGSIIQIDGTLLGQRVTKDPSDHPQGTEANGKVSTGADGFILNVWIGKAPLSLDYNRFAADAYLNRSPHHTVVIDGSDEPGQTRYKVKATQKVIPADGARLHGRKVTFDRNDSVSKNRAKGFVKNGADGFHVLGDELDVNLADDSAATVYVDGINFEEYRRRMGMEPSQSTKQKLEEAANLPEGLAEGESPLSPRSLVIDGSVAKNRSTSYTVEFTTTSIQKADGTLDGRQVSKDNDDKIQGSTVKGSVGGGGDGYTFFGNITSLKMDDPKAGQIIVDGKPVALGN